MRRREFITLLGGATVAWPLAASAQVTHQVPKVGWLKIQGPHHTPDQLQAFRDGMRALGLIEGRDYMVEERYADGDEDLLPPLATELINSGVKIILATSQPSIAAAWRVTKRMLRVIGRMVDDPVTDGMAQSLARPGGNVSGIYTMTEEMNPKRLALLKEIAPLVRRVGILLRQDFPTSDIANRDWQAAGSAAHHLELELLALNVHTAEEIAAAFDYASAKNVQGIITFRNPTVVTNLELIASLSRKHRLPGSVRRERICRPGGSMSYGPNIDATYRQLATYVYKLLHGTPVR